MFLKSKLTVRSLPKKLFLKVLTKVLSEIFLISVEMGAVELKVETSMERLYMEAQDGLKTIAPPLFLNIFFYFLLV